MDAMIKYIKDPDNITDFGLKLLIEQRKDFTLSQEVVDIIMQTVIKIAIAQPKALVPVAEKAEGEADDDYNAKVELIKADNEKITKENA